MPERTRSLDIRVALSGSYHNYTLGTESQNLALSGTRLECVDVVGERFRTLDGVLHQKDNPFDLTRTTVHVPVLNGCYPDDVTPQKEFIDFPIERQVGAPPSNNPAFGGWDPVAIAHRVASVTNPSGTNFSVPVAVGELKDFVDLPENLRMMMKSFVKIHRRHSGRPGSILSAFKEYLGERGHEQFRKSLPKQAKSAANANLLYQFVVKPMVGDFLKMLEVRKSTDHNLRVLKHLKEGNTLKRKALLGIDTIEDPPYVALLQTEGAIIKAVCTTSYKLEEWATIRWELLNPDVQIPETDQQLLLRARRMALGLTNYQALQSSYALLPWTWLGGWFADVNSVIRKFDNSIPARIEAICYMRRTTSRRSYEVTDIPEWVELSRVPLETEIRKRRFVIPAFVASLPFVPGWRVFNARQWSILGSLVAQRVIK